MATAETKPLAFGFNTPFSKQLDFFRAKLNLPSARWDDIMRSAHDRAFIVAGAQKADLLADLRGAVGKAINEGGGLDEFRKDFRKLVQKHGWTGWTGEGSKAGEAWRTKVIYQTNMATSYAAGRYRQMTDPAFVKLMPYWRYVHADGVMHPRPLHQAWNGLTLRHDHPFWQTHFPPNGWGCHCRAVPVREPGPGDKTAPPAGWDALSEKTGVQIGIDRGFDYTPGASASTPLRQMVQDKLITYPDAITKALTVDVNRYINASQDPAQFVREVLADSARTDPLWLGFVENYKEIDAATGLDLKGRMVLLPPDAPRHVELSHGADGGSQRASRPGDYSLISSLLATYDDIQNGADSPRGLRRFLVTKKIGRESFRAVFEDRPGKRNRSVALVSLVIKTR